MSFFLKRTDDMTATVLNRAGDEIRVLAERRLPAGRRMRLAWDGTDVRGRTVADGIYRIRLTLRRQGRAVLIPRNIAKDTTPPKIVVTGIGPSARSSGPSCCPAPTATPRWCTSRRPGERKEVEVFRTDATRPRRARQARQACRRRDALVVGRHGARAPVERRNVRRHRARPQ